MRSRWVALLILGFIVVGIGLLWKLTPLADVVQPARLASQLESLGHEPWGPVAMLGLFVIGGFLMVPLLALITATALIFDPLMSIPIALTGALMNASALYFAGAKLVRGKAERSFGAAIARVRGALQSRGVIAIAILRSVPVAPFSLVNVAAGSIGIPFGEYLLGTALGVAPGIVLMSVFGNELKDLARDPSLSRVLAIVAIVVVWVMLSLGIQRLVARRSVRA